MKLSETTLKKAIKEQLEEWEFQAEAIPRSSKKTPDFKFWDENNKYLLEIKIKEDDAAELKIEQEELKKGEIVERAIPAGRRNRLYGLIADGVDQLQNFDPNNNYLHLIWFQATGRDEQLLFKRLHATLFGAQDLMSTEISNLITCYYFHDSAFFTHKCNLDGVIRAAGNQIQLCINEFSLNVSKLRLSKLCEKFGKGVCNPVSLENAKEAFIADCDTDRKNTTAVINYLKTKYGLTHLQAIDLMQHSGTMLLPRK